MNKKSRKTMYFFRALTFSVLVGWWQVEGRLNIRSKNNLIDGPTYDLAKLQTTTSATKMGTIPFWSRDTRSTYFRLRSETKSTEKTTRKQETVKLSFDLKIPLAEERVVTTEPTPAKNTVMGSNEPIPTKSDESETERNDNNNKNASASDENDSIKTFHQRSKHHKRRKHHARKRKHHGKGNRPRKHRKRKRQGKDGTNKRHHKRKHRKHHGKKALRDGKVVPDGGGEQRSHKWPKVKKGKKHGRNREKSKGTTKITRTTKPDYGDKLRPYSIKAHLESLKCKFRRTNITFEVIGRTVSYNDIVMMKVSAPKKHSYNGPNFRAEKKNIYDDDAPEKRIVFIVHGLSVMGIHKLPCLLEVKPFQKLLSYYFAHLNMFDIFLVPMANPDGVAVPSSKFRPYTQYSGLEWNKNTSPQKQCSGVALDRNFDVAWNVTRHNVSSCNQQYPGPHPFSEVETQAIRNVLHRYSHRIVAFLNVHSGTYTDKIFKGDAILYPRGYTETQSDDDRYIDLRGEVEEALKNASFQVYTVGVDTLYSWYGKVGGTSVDYAATVYGIPYSMELVMQIYKNSDRSKEEEKESHAVLTTAWRRVIDVIFVNIERHVNNTGVR